MTEGVDERAERKIRASQTIRTASFVIVAVVLGLWAAANTKEVEVEWLIASTRGPLVVVIAISAGLGLLLGLLLGWRRRR